MREGAAAFKYARGDHWGACTQKPSGSAEVGAGGCGPTPIRPEVGDDHPTDKWGPWSATTGGMEAGGALGWVSWAAAQAAER